MWKVIIETDDQQRTTVPLTRDTYAVGRAVGNDIRLTERNVSRRHALLRRTATSFVLTDVGSQRGVFRNGARVLVPTEVALGDLVEIGDYRLLFEHSATLDGEAGAAAFRASRPNRLVGITRPVFGIEFPLTKPRLTVGRAEEVDIFLPGEGVSRMHCEILTVGGEQFEIVDKGSANGVCINGNMLRRGFIEPGDTIELGDVKLRYVRAGEIFRSAANAAENLEPPGRARWSKAMPIVVFVVVVAVGLTIAFAVMRL